MIKKLLLVLLIAIGVLLAYLLFWPVPISPEAWQPPEAPALAGPYQRNIRLAPTKRLSMGEGHKPEDVAIDSQDRIYAGMEDGRIMRRDQATGKTELFSDTRGRPLGMAFDAAGNLIVADAIRGLLSIGKDGVVSLLTDGVDGATFMCLNDLDIAADGTIYFTEASGRFPMINYKADLIEHGHTGRLLSYDPKTKITRTLLPGLSFANGVAVSPDQSFVLVAETGEYRIRRLWLTGSKAGQSDIFIENLPGFPDGISSNRRDKIWVALVTPRDKTLDGLLPRPFLRKVVMRLPKFLQPAPQRFGFVLGLDTNGQVVANLQDNSSECYAQIANVLEHNGALYFGSIGEDTVGRLAD